MPVARLILLVLLVTCASTARAEIARLQAGADRFGQGWLYVDFNGGCRILTAAHVVADGTSLLPIVVRDRRGRELQTGPAEILSTEYDVAILPVQVASVLRDCSSSRLSQIGVERRVANLRDAVIETTGATEARVVPVERTASRIDSAGGSKFAVRPKDSREQLTKGWSGSIVKDAEGPVGVVVDVEGSEALAVRIDVLGGLTSRPPATPAATRQFNRFIVLRGRTPDPAAGPAGTTDASKPAWRVEPQNGQVVIALSSNREQAMREVIVEQDGEGSPALISVAVEVGLSGQAEGDFVALRTCPLREAGRQIACAFVEQARRDIRLAIQASGPLTIRRILVR